MTTRPLETEGKAPRYQDGDDEIIDPRNHDLQERMSAMFMADAQIVADRIRASHGADSYLLEMLGLVSK
jgi:hypothetical protein